MASSAEEIVDAELAAWLEKEAANEDEDGREEEMEVLRRWQQNPNSKDFEWLYNRHQGMIYRAGERYLKSTTLPKAAVRSDMLRNYITTLKKWDPDKGAGLSTYLYQNMQHTGRYLVKNQNIGQIPENRATLIGLYQNRLAHLTESLGREPSNAELADDMTSSLAEVAELNKLKKITPKTVDLLRREVRRDLMADMPGAEIQSESSRLLDHLVFLHGSLSPEQQVVLEHTYPGFGKEVVDDPVRLAPMVGMSPQKIRAIRKQIYDRAKKYF